MKPVKEIPYVGSDHAGFDVEWLSHKGASEWWYATGVLYNDNKSMYSYQIVLIKAHLGIMTPWMTQLALTDFATGEHHYFSNKQRNDKDVTISETEASHKDDLSIVKTETGINIKAVADKFSFSLTLDYGKGAFWHCDNGLLLMGTPTTKETTIYYSYPNMPTTGNITLGDKSFAVTGKSWFDKQGGPYRLTDGDTHWEWFSLRFFDEEEIMLFSFPQHGYVDGTYIKADTASRLNDYTLKEERIIEVKDMKFASGWEFHAPTIKEEDYIIRPIIDGQMNGVYFEQLCDIINRDGEKVGLCFVELLPGARNKKFLNSLMG